MQPSSILLFIFLLLAGKSITSGQVLGLEVRNISTAKRDFIRQRTPTSQLKDTNRSVRLSIKLGKLGLPKEGIHLEWFFIAKELSTKTRWVFDAGSRHSTSYIDMEVECAPLHARESKFQHYALEVLGDRLLVTTTRSTVISGSKIEGWIVRVKNHEGRILETEASLSELEDFAKKNPKRLDELLSAQTKPLND